MARLGIIGTVQLAAVLAFALPAAAFGIQRLLAGDRLLGAAFVGLAVLMVAAERLFVNPLDPGDLAEAAADRVVDDKD